MSDKNKTWKVWPTHWAGGADSMQVNGQNTIWIESDEHGVICLMRPESGGRVTDSTYAKAAQIVNAVNSSASDASLLAEARQALERAASYFGGLTCIEPEMDSVLSEAKSVAARLREREAQK